MTRLVVLAFLLAAGCGKNDKAPAAGTPVGRTNGQQETGPNGSGGAQPNADDPALAEAKKLFATTCQACHGTAGQGNGPASINMNPKPRNYTDPAWQASVTDDEIKKVILEGGSAVGKSPMMPAQPQLKDKPDQLNALVRLIRSFGKK